MPPESGGSAGPLAKKAKEKLPDFDWSANNYELTWRLVEELKKPENYRILFPDHEGVKGPSGETKEDVYRRVAQVVHPEAYSQDPHTTGSRMKNKNVSMWKEYSGYYRRLQDVCLANHVNIPRIASGPEETAPQEVHEEWRRTVISMPVFPILWTFMPLRPEEKPKLPVKNTPAPGHLHATPVPVPHTPILDENIADQSFDGQNGVNGSIPSVSASTAKWNTNGNDLSAGHVNGKASTNGHSIPHWQRTPYIPRTSPPPHQVSIDRDYLELRHSYQEDVRLGIFTPAEAKRKIELLDKSNNAAPKGPSHSHGMPSAPPTPSPVNDHVVASSSTAIIDPALEPLYEEKAMMLGFRRPMPMHPLAHASFRDLFRAILNHAADCELQECRLDSRRRPPQLIFQHTANTHSMGSPIELAIVTKNGNTPLVQHVSAACARHVSKNKILIMDIPLHIHSSPNPGWETTVWDHTNAIIAASMRRPLSLDEIKAIQAYAHNVSSDPVFRQRMHMLTESSTLFDVLRTGLLQGNHWNLPIVPTSGSAGAEDAMMIHH